MKLSDTAKILALHTERNEARDVVEVLDGSDGTVTVVFGSDDYCESSLLARPGDEMRAAMRTMAVARIAAIDAELAALGVEVDEPVERERGNDDDGERDAAA